MTVDLLSFGSGVGGKGTDDAREVGLSALMVGGRGNGGSSELEDNAGSVYRS